jgi:hypothetical protein
MNTKQILGVLKTISHIARREYYEVAEGQIGKQEKEGKGSNGRLEKTT